MIVWRICKASRAKTAFDGEGARLFPGRWNDKGVAVVYCAGSLALACLEVFVHLDPDDLPDDLVSIRVEVPDSLAVEEIDPTKLPRSWRKVPGPPALRRLGSEWVAQGRSVALRVPSAIIPDEHNVLLNPRHPDMAKVVLGLPRRFTFDPRMRR